MRLGSSRVGEGCALLWIELREVRSWGRVLNALTSCVGCDLSVRSLFDDLRDDVIPLSRILLGLIVWLPNTLYFARTSLRCLTFLER